MAAKNMEELEEGEIRESVSEALKSSPVPDKSLKEKKNMFTCDGDLTFNLNEDYLERIEGHWIH